MIKGVLSSDIPINEYAAINQLGYPNMMITASGGRVRIKEIAASTFRPYDINVCKLEPVGPSFRISFANGFLFVGYGLPSIERNYFPHPGFHFNLVKAGDAYKIMVYGVMCMELFEIRKVDIDMSEMVRIGLTFGHQPRAVRQKNFYGSDKYSRNLSREKLTSSLLRGF
ncbi:UNVERIFIED_CONTAM: hypothetical protein PYX00_011871 [Menopon gallinae]|uniref:dCTP deaminase n=1 Tax=Menopon gallinae TaxID=328185 RepID=A0AAW2H8Y6_9NEOP